MSYENYWPQVSANLSATGTSGGYVIIPSTTGFYVRQQVTVSGAASSTNGVVKEVLSLTTMRIGPDDGHFPGTAYDMSSYVATNTVFAPFQQIQYRGNSNPLQVVYETEPTKALRVMTVDSSGSYVAPTSVSVSVNNVSVTVLNTSLTLATAAATFQYIKVSASTITAGNASVTQAFNAGSFSAPGRVYQNTSNCGSAIGVSFNGSQIGELQTGESFGFDLASNGRTINTSVTIGLWNISTTSVTGSVRIQIVS